MIHVEDYHKVYRETIAVSGLSFKVESGEILGLIGPNGAGKTTTLRALAGIVQPTRGRVSVAGCDLRREPLEAKRRLAFFPDTPKLFEELTADEHLSFIASVYQVANYAPRAEELLRRFELIERRKTCVQELSRGMRQKVALCCGLLHEPKVLLFDEPLSGLDPRAIRTLKDSIVEEARRGAAVLISSHLLSLVENLCSNILILDRGQQRFCGGLDELRQLSVEGEEQSLEDLFLMLTSGAPGEQTADE